MQWSIDKKVNGDDQSKSIDGTVGREGLIMINDVLKADTGIISRLRGFKPNTTLTSLNLSGDVEDESKSKERLKICRRRK